jgi:hypothetical protein
VNRNKIRFKLRLSKLCAHLVALGILLFCFAKLPTRSYALGGNTSFLAIFFPALIGISCVIYLACGARANGFKDGRIFVFAAMLSVASVVLPIVFYDPSNYPVFLSLFVFGNLVLKYFFLAFIEEMVFRFWLLKLLKIFFKKTLVIVFVSAILFCLAHSELILSHVTFGVTMAVLALNGVRIIPLSILHASVNLTRFLLRCDELRAPICLPIGASSENYVWVGEVVFDGVWLLLGMYTIYLLLLPTSRRTLIGTTTKNRTGD